ncbi:MAG TPA: hypothetical protein VGJ09_18270, partial [Bryobacteraceae bacterium]
MSYKQRVHSGRIVFCLTAWVLPAAFMAGIPAAAQTADPAQCQTLRHHGDPQAAACFQRLTRAADPAA